MEDEGTRPNDVRSIGVFFGPEVTSRFLRRNKLHLVVRSHYIDGVPQSDATQVCCVLRRPPAWTTCLFKLCCEAYENV